jgi:murein DD-endopeptidase MepM/ murein hydrolase activator NlpD
VRGAVPVYQPRLLPNAAAPDGLHRSPAAGFSARPRGEDDGMPSCPPPVLATAVRAVVVGSIVLMGGVAMVADAAYAGVDDAGATAAAAIDLADRGWVWPLESFTLERRYEAPAHRYGAGHRGVDVRPVDAGEVRAPADGTVAFSGPVAGRGILTIDHGDGFVTTLEPIDSPLEAGESVLQGAPVGVISLGGHSAPGALHFGVRYRGEYINPMLLLGEVPRAVLLPCC